MIRVIVLKLILGFKSGEWIGKEKAGSRKTILDAAADAQEKAKGSLDNSGSGEEKCSDVRDVQR